MKRGVINTILFYLVIAFPFWMLLAWFFWPKTKLVIAIVDKTVPSSGQEHASLNWVLRNNKFSKTSQSLYQKKRDYFGFFPNKEKKFDLKGLERASEKELEKLSHDSDIAYFTDTYGIYYKEQHYLTDNTIARKNLLYGGLSAQDMTFLKKMKQKNKLIITEFNTFATPTADTIAKDFEQTFKIKWTGWVGKYFDSFDTLKNKELPIWLVDAYKTQNNNQWPFKKAGIAFVHKNNKIVILEYLNHLYTEVPYILTQKKERERYGIPKSIKYPFWFDVIQTSKSNHIVSFYDLKVNDAGLRILSENNIPPQFPAIIEHYSNDYKFYYFCGDFADNPISQASSYFKGITYFRRLFYNNDIAAERTSFFWEFYRPMMSSILHDYHKELTMRNSQNVR